MELNQNEADELNQEVEKRVKEESVAYEDKNFLELYALYMLRVQMYEFSLKQDLREFFNVTDDDTEKMSLGGVYNHFKKNNIKASQVFFGGLESIRKQRNRMAHDFLTEHAIFIDIVGEAARNRAGRKLHKAIFELEMAYHYYVIGKENKILYDL